MKVKPKSQGNRLSSQDVKRAIFLDYEGNMDKPPTLLGWRINGETFGVIVEPLFAICEQRHRARYVVALDHREVISELINRAHNEGRFIVTWSTHDLREMQRVSRSRQLKLLTTVYRNALGTVRPWYRNTYEETAANASLAFFSELFGLEVPERFGTGIVGSALGYVRSQLNEGRSYGALTPKARAGWVAVVRHNEYDLNNMEKVLRRVVAL